MDLAWIVSSSRSSLSFVSRGTMQATRGFCQLSLSLFLFHSSSLPAVSIEKPPVSYYSPAVCHCARRTKRHGADPCLIRPKYSANIRMNARAKRQAGKVHGPGKDVLKVEKGGTRDTTMPPLIILAENAMQLIGRLVIAVNGDRARCQDTSSFLSAFANAQPYACVEFYDGVRYLGEQVTRTVALHPWRTSRRWRGEGGGNEPANRQRVKTERRHRNEDRSDRVHRCLHGNRNP